MYPDVITEQLWHSLCLINYGSSWEVIEEASSVIQSCLPDVRVFK